MKTKADRTRPPRSTAHYLRLLIAPAILGLAAITPAHAQQVLNLVPGEQVYPWVEQEPSAAGGQSIRKLKTTKTSSGKEVVADRVLIQLQKGLTAAEQLQIHQQASSLGAGAAKSVLQLPNGYYLVDVTGASVEAAVQAYRAADSRVLAAGPDSIMKADATTNDPLLADQWYLDRIQAKEAWDRSRGAGIKVAILDTGIDESLPDLAGKVDARWNTVLSSSSNTNDDVGHGTSVAGIVAATANNMIGVAGVGPDVRLLNVKIAVDGIFIPSAAAAGIYWAADHGAHVLNMSFGITYDCALSHPDVTVLRNALAYASTRNMVLVAAAGNDGITAKTTPASCPTYCQWRVTPDDVVASRSTRGTWVQVAAPAVSVLSTRLPGERDPRVDPCRPLNGDDSYGYCGPASGFTSFAAPIVSGIAALVRASCSLPDLSIHHQTVVNRITSTADAIAGTGTHWKYGRVNAKNAVCIPQPALTHTGATPTSLSFSWNDRSSESSFEFWHRPLGGRGAPCYCRLTGPSTHSAACGWSLVRDHSASLRRPWVLRVCSAPGQASELLPAHCHQNRRRQHLQSVAADSNRLWP